MNIEDYKQAGFEDGEYNQYESSDYIQILKDDICIDLSNIKLNKLVEVSDEIKIYNLFNGICCYTSINKNVEKIYIKRSIQNVIKRSDQILLDNEYFEKCFNIYSKNRMLTMQILTPQVMENMLEFIKNNATNFEIIIRNRRIYFKFYSGPISQPVYFSFTNKKRIKMNKRYIYYYYSIFKFIIKMAEYFSKIINELDV